MGGKGGTSSGDKKPVGNNKGCTSLDHVERSARGSKK